jgi:hypothetical protein
MSVCQAITYQNTWRNRRCKNVNVVALNFLRKYNLDYKEDGGNVSYNLMIVTTQRSKVERPRKSNQQREMVAEENKLTNVQKEIWSDLINCPV